MKKQEGAALIISLIFLLILSLIGVSSMQGTTMQEKMAGNLRDMYVSINTAEAALVEGERQAAIGKKNGTLDKDNDLSGAYTLSNAFISLPGSPGWQAELHYVVTDLSGPGSPELASVLRVTASSAGTTGTSDIVLESLYLVK
ncbi:MAG: hypothetical protein CSA61_01700 [Neptuniibacter caesariensis]|uniref:Type 4 fimbrial biogenesis protein PilX N-terminal domain-containing protein n=1 Tax=Neptuniibacter caesariensis TaxID=207954 RepID=A0A2G6JAL9_NEPCE|nr:MAG: hypothetical protein CSA61_01700 [Neptuniibacter caesariensis]